MDDDAISEMLDKAVNNENNENITSHALASIEKTKAAILGELELSQEEQTKILGKLEGYRHVDEMPEFRTGCYIRWIRPTETAAPRLTNGGILVDVSIRENGVHLRCRNNRNRIFQLCIDDVFIFQKLTPQENVILSMIDIINGDHN